MHRRDDYLRDMVAQALQSAIDPLVVIHWPRLTQEHQLTSRIAQSIEAHLSGATILGHKVTVLVQEMPDKGAGSLEKKTGVDLYIAMKVQGKHTNFEKGIFVQAKWEEAMQPKERKRLAEQCEEMSSRSKIGSVVWLYSPAGTGVVPASEIAESPDLQPSEFSRRNLNEFFADVMDCTSGDRSLVFPGVFSSSDALNAMLREFSIKQGVSIAIVEADAQAQK